MVSLKEYSSIDQFDDKRRSALSSLLYSDETFIYAIDVYDAVFRTDARASKLVLTDQRVIEFQRGFIRESSKDFRLEDIASIEYDKGYVMRKVTLEGQGISKDFQTLEDYGRTFVTAVREQMARNEQGLDPIDAPVDIESENRGAKVPHKYGSIWIHLILIILTFWTFGIVNVAYAGYSYYTFNKQTNSDNTQSNLSEADDIAATRSSSELQTNDTWEFDRIDEQPYDHYTDALEDIKSLKRQRAHEYVEPLLLWCIEYAEAEAEVNHYPDLPRAYYEDLAIVYRKDDRYDDEVAILERYISKCEELGGEPHTKLTDRLSRARELVAEK